MQAEQAAQEDGSAEAPEANTSKKKAKDADVFDAEVVDDQGK